MGAAALCLKLPQTMTSNNHRECGAGGRKKGRENGECDQWLTFQDDWHRLKTILVTVDCNQEHSWDPEELSGSRGGREENLEFSEQKKMTENETTHCLWTGHTLESEITITAKRPLSVKSII